MYGNCDVSVWHCRRLIFQHFWCSNSLSVHRKKILYVIILSHNNISNTRTLVLLYSLMRINIIRQYILLYYIIQFNNNCILKNTARTIFRFFSSCITFLKFILLLWHFSIEMMLNNYNNLYKNIGYMPLF